MARSSRSWLPLAPAALRQAGLLALGALLVGGPLGVLLLDPPAAIGPGSPVSPWTALTDAHFRGLAWTSLRLAGWTTAVALGLGVPFGLWLAWTRSRAAAPLAVAHLLPLCLPPYVTGLAYASVLGRQGVSAQLAGDALGAWTSRWFYGDAGVVLVLAVALAPIVTLLTAGFARRIDASRIEAGLVHRGAPATLLQVVLPLAAPGIGAGALLVFLLALGEVGVPQLLRVPVYASVVFGRLADLSFQPGEALALALPMILLSLLVATGLTAADMRARQSRGLRAPTAALRLRGAGAWLMGGIALGATAVAVVPLGVLLGEAGTGSGGGWAALGSAWPALSNSLGYAATSATVLAALAAVFGAGWSARPRSTGLLASPLLLGLVLPAGVYALALVATWNRPATGWLYRGDALVVLALCGRYAYLALRLGKLGRDQTPDAWLEAARLTRVGPLRRWLTIELPLQREILGLTWLASFLLTFRDMETTILFYPPGGESLPVRTMTLEANAPPGLTAATATVQVTVTLITLVLAALLWQRSARRARS